MSTSNPTTPRQLRIDFVSDVSCPWCAVGLGALEQALERVAPEIQAELHFQPFELNPQMPREGQDSVEHLVEKYGIDEAQVRANGERIRERGATVGFDFDLERRKRVWNTFDAHRLLHWADEVDADKQRALKKSLFKAYFTDGLNPSDPELLVRLAGEAGLDTQRARQIVEGDEFAAATRARERLYTGAGIHSVPAIIIDNKHLISGGQPAEIFERALRQIAGAAPQQTAEA